MEVPLYAVDSTAKFVVLDDELSIVSEHGDTVPRFKKRSLSRIVVPCWEREAGTRVG